MADKPINPVSHFGKQLKKERLARGWSLPELSRRSGIDAGHLSRIENGKRPPTAKIALAIDAVFPERKGWFTEFYDESRTWAPPGFRDWSEYEDKSVNLRDWWPSIISGLLQTEDYARELLLTYPGVSAEVVGTRLAGRMDRQRRLFARDMQAWFILDEFSLYRLVGSNETMAAQMRHLREVAALPNVTLQVLPGIAHPAGTSGFIIADDAAYAEHAAGGFVYTGESASPLLRLFYTIQGESYRVSESLKMIERVGELWTGGSPAFPTPTAEPA